MNDDAIQRLRAALGDRYRIELELGRGGMATVYLAEDLKHHRQVAVKVLKPELAAVLGVERFLREIEIAARLHHPHILPLYDSGEAAGFLYYVMPFVQGESLRARLDREDQLPLDDALLITREVADALAYAHSRDVIHRDIKPENILLESGHAMVADFGIARAISAAGGDRITETGIAVGTPSYMSPEQAAGDSRLDGRSDLYALGCVLHEMLTGSPPFTGPTSESVVRQHLTAEPPVVSTIRPTVPPPVAGAVHRSLQKAPADRYSTVERFAAALAMSAAGREPAADALGNGPRKPPVRRALPWAAAAGVVLAAGIGWQLVKPEASPATLPVATPAPTPDVASIAVLPFDNMSGDPNDVYLSEGMTEEIISQLAKVPGLKVISRTSVGALAGGKLTLPQIADTLGVRHILEGSVRRAGNRVRVTAQLIDANTDAHLWSESYERALTDLFAVQDEIAREVSAALAMRVVGPAAPGPASRTAEQSAYDAFLRGKYALHRRTRDGLQTAIAAFEEAVSRDSGYAPALAALAAAYGLWVTYGYPGDPDPYVAYGRGIVLAGRAIHLDPTLAEAYAARAYIQTKAGGPTRQIAEDFARALDLTPSSADVHGWYAHFLAEQRRWDQALAEARRAIELDPLAPGRRVGYALDALGARRYEMVKEQAQGALALEPDLTLPRWLLAVSYLLLGAPARCVEIDPGPFLSARAMCLAALDRRAEARAVVDTLVAAARGTGDAQPAVAAGQLATYYAWIGDTDRAVEWLRQAFARSPNAVDFRVVDSAVFDRVRDDPGFGRALENIGRDVRERVQAEIARLETIR